MEKNPIFQYRLEPLDIKVLLSQPCNNYYFMHGWSNENIHWRSLKVHLYKSESGVAQDGFIENGIVYTRERQWSKEKNIFAFALINVKEPYYLT